MNQSEFFASEACVACCATVTRMNCYHGKDGTVRTDVHQVCAEQFGKDFMALRW